VDREEDIFVTISKNSSLNQAPSVLFVCTANMIRSPIAAALFRSRLANKRPDWQEWRIDSAGTWALDGEMASKNALER
jgi:protein-tyrosine-phosphatase